MSKLQLFEQNIELPSRGKFYKGKLPDGQVKIKPITVAEEKYFTATKDKASIINTVLDRCILSKELKVGEYLLTDQFFILLNIRSLSYGPEYSFEMICRACETKYMHLVLLPKGLILKIASDDDTEPFPIDLPNCGSKLMCRFLRGDDETDIRNFVKQATVSDGGDPAYVYRLSKQIVSIDGKELDVIEKLMFCENMIGADSVALRDGIAKQESGVDLEIVAVCPRCKEETKIVMPFTADFFRPGIPAGRS